MSTFDRFEKMLAARECEQLITNFALLNDSGDYQKISEMFTEHGIFCRPSLPNDEIKGKEAILQAFKDRPVRLSRHFVCNTQVTLVSPTEATALSYILLVSAPGTEEPSLAVTPHLIGQFKDRLCLKDGNWLFEERRGSLQLKIAN